MAKDYIQLIPVKYLGVKIDSKLGWRSHVKVTATKLKQIPCSLQSKTFCECMYS